MRFRNLFGLFTTLGLTTLFAVTPAQAGQTTTQQTKGAPTITTEQLRGEVVKVEGSTLVVKMSTGELRTFTNIPDSRRATVDGVDVGVRDLKPGTRLTANITKTTTPVVTRTTTLRTAKVWYVSPPYVILTLPDGQNKQYMAKDDFKFIVNNQPATVFDLRPGMSVSAEKIVEEPTTEITTESKVVGQAPAPAAAKPAATSAKPAAATAKPSTSVPPSSSAKPAAPPPAAAPATASNTNAAPATLPKTASPVVLMGLLGLLMIGAALSLRRRVRR